jgi:hypothetical protein
VIESKIIYGVKYTVKFNGIAYAEQFDNECCRRGNKSKMSKFKAAKKMFSEVFIEPQQLIDEGIDFFDNFENSLEVFDEVFDFGLNVLRGKIGKKYSKTSLKKVVKDNWAAWRLIYSDMGNFTYDYVFHKMTPLEIETANVALDIVMSQLNKKK